MQVQPANQFAPARWAGRAGALLLTLACGACTSNPAAPNAAPEILVATRLSPSEAAVFDNGCSPNVDPIEWNFDWSDVPGATAYHLHVQRAGSTFALIDRPGLRTSAYQHSAIAYIIPANATGWGWRVRAEVRGAYQAWSPVRTFSVEPMNTDCS